MNFVKDKAIYLIVILFCFDSLFKLNVGFGYLHLSVILIATIFLFGFFDKHNFPGFGLNVVYFDKPVLMLIVFTFVHFLFAESFQIYVIMFSYLLFFAFIYSYVFSLFKHISLASISFVALVSMIGSGYFQYFLNHFGFNISLRGIDDGYYLNIGDRLRGFFLEPNWYGLVLYSWLYVFATSVKRYDIKFYVVVALSIGCLLLSNNRLVYFFIALLIFHHFIILPFGRIRVVFPFIFVVCASVIFIYSALNYDLIDDRSAVARLYTAANVFDIFLHSDLWVKLVGHGFSNWGSHSNEFGFSWSNYMVDQSLLRRDNAENYVYLYEMGVLSIFVFIYDLIFCAKVSKSLSDPLFLATIIVASFFYPIYTFMFYMIPYMFVRSRLLHNKHIVQ